MITKEEFYQQALHDVVRGTIQTLLRTRDLSKRFLARDDIKEVDKDIDRISDDITKSLMEKMKSAGWLEDDDKTLDERSFEQLFRSTVAEYFGEERLGGSKNRAS